MVVTCKSLDFLPLDFEFFFPLLYYGCLEVGKAQSGAMQGLYREE